MKRLVSLYKYIVYTISFFFLLFFSWLSLVSTSTLNPKEHIYLVNISGSTGLIALLILIALFMLTPVRERGKKFEAKLQKSDFLFRILYYVLFIILLFLGIEWVLATRFDSWSDSLSVQIAAQNLIAGDYTEYLPGGYIDTWQNQIGIVLLESIVFRLFGSASPIIFQIFNAFCVAFIFLALTEFVELRLQKLIVLLFGIVWFPMIVSASHIYGNIPGLAFALWGGTLLFRYKEKSRPVHAVLSVLCMAFACLIKENYLIFVIAYILTGAVMSIRMKKLKPIIVSVMALFMSLVLLKGAVVITENITDIEMNGGVNPISYIAMGMQSSERGPGWFNGYNGDTYRNAGYDGEAQKPIVVNNIKNGLKYFAQHPAFALDFYTRKMASQWNEPSFQCLWILRSHEGELPHFIDYLVSIEGYDRAILYLKVFQVMVYILAFVMICNHKSLNDRMDQLLVTFVGGVLFHLMWEAKAQYTIVYFVLLIPIAVSGFWKLVEKVSDKEFWNGLIHKGGEKAKISGVIVGLLIFTLFLGVLYYKHIPESLRRDTAAYQVHVNENRYGR